MNCEGLTAKGLEYEENGEKKFIPRANIQDGYKSVSYTHLTLPTIYSV